MNNHPVFNICRITNLPIILKGILTAEDALIAVEHGVSGVVVSNHGGRQLDTAPASVGLKYAVFSPRYFIR